MNTDRQRKQIQLILKRLFDILVSIVGLILLMPLFLLIALAIKIDSKGPIFYKQVRIGKGGKPFQLYKFRSMVSDGSDKRYTNYLKELIESEINSQSSGLPYRKMGVDPRVTRVGRFIRRYYLDELPQLVNVLRNEMSLVGPRPHVQLEVDYYTPEQWKRLSVKPGATGLWQAVGKADCTFNQLIAMDLDYIDHWSLELDLRIIYTTIKILSQGGEKDLERLTKKLPERLLSIVPPGDTAAPPTVNREQEVESGD